MKPYTSQGSSSSVTGANPTGPTQGTGAPANQKQAPNRRTKERKIGFIIEKVALWRKLYNGIKGADGELVRYSLEDAAHRVGISKKSLDDYLLQLRFGRKFGFNFNDNRNAKVGVLRSFVKQQKALAKAKEGQAATGEEPDNSTAHGGESNQDYGGMDFSGGDYNEGITR
mmetsp:Transcript_15962/g.17829  ORF Transcript_15962/g.17829 Transcript_15962/m.17829 type:complete len:170 (+) Transcript_15962:452-961(+)